MSIACACTDGRSGAQTCTAEGTFTPCECTGGVDVGVELDGGQSDLDAGGLDANPATVDAGTADTGPVVDSDADINVGSDAPASTGHVLSVPVDLARVLISDATTGDLYPRTEFTYEFWINFDRIVPTLTQFLLVAEGGSPVGLLGVWIDEGDTLECVLRAAGGHDPRVQLASASTMVTTRAWHHIACTGSDTGRVALFLDGVEVDSDSASGAYQLPPPGATLGLGSGPHAMPSTTWRFNGLIDEFRVSNRRMYFANFTPSRRLTVETSTVALFHFDEGTGTSAMDEVGPGRHMATLERGATWASE